MDQIKGAVQRTCNYFIHKLTGIISYTAQFALKCYAKEIFQSVHGRPWYSGDTVSSTFYFLGHCQVEKLMLYFFAFVEFLHRLI